MASVDIDGKTPKTVKFTAMWVSSGTKTPASGVTWSLEDPSLATIDGSGLLTTGSLGGVVTVDASVQGAKGSAPLTIRLVIVDNAAPATAAVQSNLRGASSTDATTQFAYPYDGTVWPRQLPTPKLMWTGGVASDIYRLHVSAPTLEYEGFVTAPPPARAVFPGTDWFQITQSISGGAAFGVDRWNGTSATVVAKQKWTIAPGSLRGTVYYNYLRNPGTGGALPDVVRIQPGASAAEDFLGATGAGGCISCHTVSANGSVITIGGDVVFGGGSTDCEMYGAGVPADCKSTVYDFATAKYLRADPVIPRVLPGKDYDRPWSFAALSPDGAYAIRDWGTVNAVNRMGVFNTADAGVVPNTGLTFLVGQPAFAPNGKGVAYVAGGVSVVADLRYFDIDLTKLAITNDRQLASYGGTDPNRVSISWPSVTPDGNWVVYQRGVSPASTTAGDLFFTSAASGAAEVELSALDGETYPFVAGNRDRHWNFEPTFAPVASGGYFWVVFSSRRTYGNLLTGGATTGFGTGLKQLWVAAIDLAPKAGADPSHPAFLLPGQDASTLNARGFWAKAPCKANDEACGAGDECCSGFCIPSGDGGAGGACGSPGNGMCSAVGDKCTTASDCCSGIPLCINSVCSVQPPQ